MCASVVNLQLQSYRLKAVVAGGLPYNGVFEGVRVKREGVFEGVFGPGTGGCE